MAVLLFVPSVLAASASATPRCSFAAAPVQLQPDASSAELTPIQSIEAPRELAFYPALENLQEETQTVAAQPFRGPLATVHGVVRNTASGEPLPRALVRIEGDASTGTLTDGDGRFEIPGVPVGPQAFQVVKPGFRDQAVAGMIAGAAIVNGATNSEHNVQVSADMPDLLFTMSPTNSIRGQIELSTGDPAQGIGVMLLRRSVQDGRAVWQPAFNVRTNSDGIYRFAGLIDGVYAVYTDPAMDSDLAVSLVEAGSDHLVTRTGFATLFYPDARDLNGAAKIQLSGGQQAQANLLLTQEAFHMVRATVRVPGDSQASTSDRPGMSFSFTVFDAQGHQLSYTAQYDQASRTVQAFLPDGTYSLLATAINVPMPIRRGPDPISRLMTAAQGPLVGQVDFSVAGHAVANLRIPLTAQRSNTLQVALVRTAQVAPDTGTQGSPIVVMLSQAGGWITDGMVTTYAEGYASGPMETTFVGPGSYWVHATIPQKSLCEASFTAGGASLAREPLALSLSGATAPLTLTLRDDCASLKLSLPAALDSADPGEEPSYTLYVVPDFNSTADVTPITLRPSSGGTITLEGLTPGAYRVYTFAAPVELEYRNPEAMAALPNPGQAVTLSPGATSNLVVEVPGH
jgi:hypothetical protein